MRKDWDGTLKAMKDFGYSCIDLNQVSPYIDRPAADLRNSFRAPGFTFTNALWSYQAHFYDHGPMAPNDRATPPTFLQMYLKVSAERDGTFTITNRAMDSARRTGR